MKIQLIRHATTLLWIGNRKILVDPMLGEKGAYAPVERVPNQSHNPLVDLPISIEELINCDALLITHLHRDHFDTAAAEKLPKDLPVFCQPQDAKTLQAFGFTKVSPIKDCLNFEGLTIHRTTAKHGHGATALAMAPVSGYVIEALNEPTLYILGDTVWYKCIEASFRKFNPDIAISYCGKAHFAGGKPITMGKEDIQKVKLLAPHTKLICIHMEAWNHCSLLRKDLEDYVHLHHLTDVIIPKDGQLLLE
jgi:L-ascorbate metabolism protein UlaG (beta-lactamase superfamily)